MKSLLFGLFCSAIVAGVLAQSVSLIPEYDDEATKLRIFTVHRPLVLYCNVTPVFETMELVWSKDGRNVWDVPELQGRFDILASENKFSIDRTIEEDHGLYACELANFNRSAIFNVVANVAARLPKNTQLIEGESLWIVCRVVGTAPSVHWILPNGTVLTNSTDRIVLERENDLENSALYIASVNLEDRGDYTCVADNAATAIGWAPSSISGIVRIRESIAPIYPVIGIVIQAFVLFVVLFIYEKWFHDTEDLDDEDYEYMPQKVKDQKAAASNKYTRKDN